MVHKSLNELAYEGIKTKIMQGEFEPGSRIREDYLAKEISMSRTPVREAINRLVSDGLIINKARKGLYLIDPTNEEIDHYLDIRISLEQLSVEKCIENITDEGLSELSDALEEFEFRLFKKKYDICIQLDNEFHQLIARLSGNEKLRSMLSELSSFFFQTRSKEKKMNPEEKTNRTLKEHKILYEAIKNKDSSAAKRAICLNINAMRDNLHIL